MMFPRVVPYRMTVLQFMTVFCNYVAHISFLKLRFRLNIAKIQVLLKQNIFNGIQGTMFSIIFFTTFSKTLRM